MSSLRRLQHVDRNDLYTSLEARIQYLQSFLDFNSTDIQALTLGSKYIRASIPLIVEKVYRKLLQYDITASYFAAPATSPTSKGSSPPTRDSPQIQYRMLFLRGYLQKLCSDPRKMEFWEYMEKVGTMHSRRNMLYVEYVHINACLGFIHDIIVEEVLLHPRLKMERKVALVRALGKVIWIQNDLFAKGFVRDGEEFRNGKASPVVEKEGFLHGRMVVNLEEEIVSPPMSEVGTPREEIGCPFAGMMDRLSGLELNNEAPPQDYM